MVSCQGSNQEDLPSQATGESRIVFVKLGFRAPKGTVGNPLLKKYCMTPNFCSRKFLQFLYLRT